MPQFATPIGDIVRIIRRGEPTETAYLLVIEYNRGQDGPNNLMCVRQGDAEKLVNVIEAYQKLTDIRGQRKTLPSQQRKYEMGEALGLSQPAPMQAQRPPFTLPLYLLHPHTGRGRRPGRLTPNGQATLQPWRMRSIKLVPLARVVVSS